MHNKHEQNKIHNIAFLGKDGTGKSSLVNSILKLKSKSKESEIIQYPEEIERGYTIYNPVTIEVFGEELVPFLGPNSFRYGVRIPESLLKKIKNPKEIVINLKEIVINHLLIILFLKHYFPHYQNLLLFQFFENNLKYACLLSNKIFHSVVRYWLIFQDL